MSGGRSFHPSTRYCSSDFLRHEIGAFELRALSASGTDFRSPGPREGPTEHCPFVARRGHSKTTTLAFQIFAAPGLKKGPPATDCFLTFREFQKSTFL